MIGPYCQGCGGSVQGWMCQGCGLPFRERSDGALVVDLETLAGNASTNAEGTKARSAVVSPTPSEGGVEPQREISDEQILAAATAIRESSVAWADEPEEFAHLIELTPAEVRKLFAVLAHPNHQASGGLVEALNLLSIRLPLGEEQYPISARSEHQMLTRVVPQRDLELFMRALASPTHQASDVSGLVEDWKEGREEGRLAARPWREGDPLPAVGQMTLVSGIHGDIESDQHRAFLWRRVVGYGEDRKFICLQAKGCWPTVERTENCWFARKALAQAQQVKP